MRDFEPDAAKRVRGSEPLGVLAVTWKSVQRVGVRAPSFRAILMCVMVGALASSAVVAAAQGRQSRRQRAAQRARAQRQAQQRARRRAAQRARQRAQARQRRGDSASEERRPGAGAPQQNAGRETERVPTGPRAGEPSEENIQSAREIDGDGGRIKVMEFTGLDISGRLKSPSLLYFLNRVRTEFDRPTLPHRSFVPEVERSADERPFEE